MLKIFNIFFITWITLGAFSWAKAGEYLWLENPRLEDSIPKRFPPPKGFQRIAVSPGSFSAWLRNLPLKPKGAKVYLYNGKKKSNQFAHAAVLDLDIGSKNLQQCADFVIRLRAEYLFSKDQKSQIQFHFTSGHLARYEKWVEGFRPDVKGNKVRWKKKKPKNDSYTNFQKYLETVFTYSGSYSLTKELEPVSLDDIQIGDVLIQGGFPGHAVIVVDVAQNPETKERAFLLAQSFMPAQDAHILINPLHPKLNPWYPNKIQKEIITPEWVFQKKDLKRFPG